MSTVSFTVGILPTGVKHFQTAGRSTRLQAVTRTVVHCAGGSSASLQKKQSAQSLKGQEKQVGDKVRQREVIVIHQNQKVAGMGDREQSTDPSQESTRTPISPSLALLFATRGKVMRKLFPLHFKGDSYNDSHLSRQLASIQFPWIWVTFLSGSL